MNSNKKRLSNKRDFKLFTPESDGFTKKTPGERKYSQQK